jgi:hypothetical protein
MDPQFGDAHSDGGIAEPATTEANGQFR